tara:strand:+ start:118 stop:696 length:579 start_codon:yes stop_codon:yes gene_type:complete
VKITARRLKQIIREEIKKEARNPHGLELPDDHSGPYTDAQRQELIGTADQFHPSDFYRDPQSFLQFLRGATGNFSEKDIKTVAGYLKIHDEPSYHGFKRSIAGDNQYMSLRGLEKRLDANSLKAEADRLFPLVKNMFRVTTLSFGGPGSHVDVPMGSDTGYDAEMDKMFRDRAEKNFRRRVALGDDPMDIAS